MCKCALTGFIGRVICLSHLQEAFNLAKSWGDKELAAVILAKAKGRI